MGIMLVLRLKPYFGTKAVKNKFLVVIALMSGLTACSSVPVNTENAEFVPEKRIYKAEMFTKNQKDASRVTFLRDSGYFGSGCSHDMYINNQKVFAIRQSEQATVYLKPDFYIFRLETGGGLCPNIAISQEIDLKPNVEAKYRILMASDMMLRFIRLQ